MSNAFLIDTTYCIGCRSCQVTCKQWNELRAEHTEMSELGLQNPATLSAKTFTMITFHEIPDAEKPGGMKYVFAKLQCMHCNEPACVSACPVTALYKTESGAVIYDADKCIGCRYCMWACPFGAPTADWDSLAPKIHKCDLCFDRLQEPLPVERNRKPLSPDSAEREAQALAEPACVKQCPTEALKFGKREDVLAEAKARIKANPERYIDHIYGEKEAGGTAVLYLASVPFSEIGLPDVGNESYPAHSIPALTAVPPAVAILGGVLGMTYSLKKRKEEVAKTEVASDKTHGPGFATLKTKLFTPATILLGILALLAGVAMVARFALGLGGSTNLSDTYAWGLWIVFDLVWIAVAGGAFATAGLIYVFHRKELYSIGRGAVLMGLLSYSFVMVTLVADLGLPWHFWQLGVQAPEHSAMFEVSWCVGLYVTILFAEFMPVVLERLDSRRGIELWTKWAPIYVIVAVSLFVYLMSRDLIWTAIAFVVFAVMAFAFRRKEGSKPVPIMLAIAAVTFSTMHQSSLGSLFLLMPDKLDPLWWSPIIPVNFFLSSIAAGLSLVILMEMWIAKSFGRATKIEQLASLARTTFIALLIYQVVRLGDLALRGGFTAGLEGPNTVLFLIETLVGGLLALILLSSAKLRSNPGVLLAGALLCLGGIVLNRANVVLFAMDLKGPIPQTLPSAYSPSLVEWAVSIGLISATILLFKIGAMLTPVLAKETD
ncbi:MAG: 4Fe-4S dicluster domain-containing protein [Deltaproteobacteria bacterium]|nr:4Fe-4S dicluster domain-containing protein [Deltaproteobacteria bacterium]